jgi:O-antigen ligase
MDAADWIASIAAVAASLGALARTTRVRRVHALGVPLLLVGWLVLAATVLPSSVREHGVVVAAAIAIALALGWFAARPLRGHERWLLALGAVVLVVRVPVPTGGDEDAMLLAPLYVVVALGAMAVVRRELALLRSGERLVPDRGGATRLLDVGAAVLPAIATASLTWSWAPERSTEALAFYLVPFVLAYAVVRAMLDARVSLRPAAVALVGTGVVLAAVGLVQALLRQVWWNPKVIDANRFRADFRTNSLLWDPNMYGRALVVVLVAVVAWLLVSRLDARRVTGAALAVLVAAAALWNTFSQSSWVALAAALALLAVLTIPPRPRRWVAAGLVVVVLAGSPVAAGALSGSDEDGRQEVVRTGLALASERPVLGWGVGAFEPAARARALERGDRYPGLVASHTTPVTVFAELGVLGMFTYLTLLASAAVTVLARWRRTSAPASAARASGDDPVATGWPIAPVIWATGTIMALLAHSMLYASFFEDPTLWVALAVLASLPAADDDVPREPRELVERESRPTRTEGATAHTG